MIKKLQVKNYKSLKNLDLELGNRNILVGPNMSGKSNLIDCLRFLSRICISGVTQAFLDRGGFQEVVWKGKEEGPIYFGLTIKQNRNIEEQKIYEYEISIVGSPTGLISIEREYLTVKVAEQVSTLIDLRNGQGEITHPDGRPAFNIADPSRSALEFSVPGWEGMGVKGYIAGWRYYHLSPDVMKKPNAAVAQQYLIEDGQNFSSWLMTLYTSFPNEFSLIKQVAKDSLPGLEEILTPPTQFGTTYLTTREKYLKQPVNIWHMSDGEILFLAWLSLIFAPDPFGAPLFCVEELENHLHPRLLETLVEVLNQRQKELGPQAAQIIVTTHSPYFVDKMNLDDLIVFEKSEGATKCTKPASKSHLRELLEREELGLGDLWYSGALGG
jgi:predicted ATPase